MTCTKDASQIGRTQAAVMGVLFYGKSFSHRSDFRLSPPTDLQPVRLGTIFGPTGAVALPDGDTLFAR
ncbi:hypothetical protein CA13_10960 [Planctomycetes bacterium CA13]|uniref:Uncharacterized protein n=1 Tax=Novipirellula herctigrandis TaxID=2527986 RepID=A0A5C5YXS8_9BACT|nr:hypothetical protein CA13_10960 [Planctomycetes bacterium CA13]